MHETADYMETELFHFTHQSQYSTHTLYKRIGVNTNAYWNVLLLPSINTKPVDEKYSLGAKQ